MNLKDKFFKYVEYQRAAEEALRNEGHVAAAKYFAQANDIKAELIRMFDEVEELQHRMWSLEK